MKRSFFVILLCSLLVCFFNPSVVLATSSNTVQYTQTTTWIKDLDPVKITSVPYDIFSKENDFIDNFNNSAERLYLKSGTKELILQEIEFINFQFNCTYVFTRPDGAKEQYTANDISGYIDFPNPPDWKVPFKGIGRRSYSSLTEFGEDQWTLHMNPTMFSSQGWLNGTIAFKLSYTCSFRATFNVGLGDVIDSIDKADKDIVNAIQNQSINVSTSVDELKDQQKKYHDEEVNNANAMNEQFNGFVNKAESDIKSKWKILWYPIEFTQSLLTVFGGGTQTQAYANKYMFVEGYEYNEETGCLDPIINYSRAINPRDGSGGAKITFPSYTLPVLNVKLWDSYTFDISSIKEDFPLLFNSLYIAIGILEIYWFVAFLRDKYDDVFGGGE